MDEDARALVIRLCTQAGMRMEDVSAAAICCRALDDNQLRSLVRELVGAVEGVAAILAAANVLATVSGADRLR
jgi:ribosomal protein S28E/S33